MIGERIKANRIRLKLSQEALAKQLGVSFQAVQQWEDGSTMPRR